MEWASNGSLGDILFEESFIANEKFARTMFRQLIDALSYMHANKSAHLDIKPENILVSEDYSLKLADFDMSYKEGDIMVLCKGTKNYRPLEQFQCKVRDVKAVDIYSAGIVLFCMFFGNLPYLEEGKINGIDLQKLLKNDIEAFWNVHQSFHPKN